MSATIEQHSNTIPEVVIGTQTWAARNYDFGGTYPNNVESYVTDYGRLYTWAEAMAIDVPGWHLPSATEMVTTLITYLGGNTVAGGKLKEVGTTYWADPNTGADNTYGFGARGSGTDETFFGEFAEFWMSNESGTDGYVMVIQYNSAAIISAWKVKTSRCSVRLIKD